MTKKRKVLHITDFSGGYSSDLPDERMDDKTLRTGTNLYWEAGLRKRKGWSQYATVYPGAVAPDYLFGSVRAYMNGAWTHVVAYSLVGTATVIHFGTDNAVAKTFVEVDNTFTVATSVEAPDRFRFAIMKVNGEDAVCGVDKEGVQKPFVIYYDSGFQIKTLEEYDIRTRTDDDWYAGTYDVSETNPYFDKTAEAQSDTADTFPLTSTTNGDGFYVAGVLTFNKFTIHSPSEFDGSPVAVYEYYQGEDTWAALTMVQTPVWGTGTSDKTFEFDYPQLWKPWDGLDAQDSTPATVEGTLYGRYVIRVRFTTAPTSAQTADNLTIYHSQYLTQIMAGDIPHQVTVHLSMLILAAGPNIQYSRPGRLTGWLGQDVEYFTKGGTHIQAMVSYRGSLVVVKGSMLYGLLGNSVDNWVVKELDATIGSDYASSVTVVNSTIFFIGSDGYIYGFNGDVAKRISKHIHSDITTLLASYTPYATAFQGNCYITIGPTVFRFDPDTVREDDMGDGIVSVWKHTSEVAGITLLDNPVFFNGDQDSNALIVQNDDEFIQLETTNYKDVYSGDNSIAIDFKTKDISFGQFGVRKTYTRVKPDVEKAATWTFTMYSDHEDVNVAVSMASGTGPGQYIEDVSIPYTIDGKDLTLRLQNTSTVFAAIYGIALNVAGRVF